jgi:hypothetical protein
MYHYHTGLGGTSAPYVLEQLARSDSRQGISDAYEICFEWAKQRLRAGCGPRSRASKARTMEVELLHDVHITGDARSRMDPFNKDANGHAVRGRRGFKSEMAQINLFCLCEN